MSDSPFAVLPGLTFLARLPGAECLARYQSAEGGSCLVERRPREGTPRKADEFLANNMTEIVLRVREVHVDGDHAYLVYEGDAACALPARVHDRRWSEEQRVETLACLAKALRDLHARGHVHGDLTPDAVLLREDGSVRFAAIVPPPAPSSSMSSKPGEARTFGPTLNRIRATGGALAYLAPEQFMANTTLAESDVFAWGCIAYELATGRSPFGFVTDPAKLLEAITKGPQRPIHEVSPRFTESFDARVRATLSIERSKRVLPSDLTGSVVEAPGATVTRESRAAASATPRWVVPAVIVAVSCAALAYFAMAR